MGSFSRASLPDTRTMVTAPLLLLLPLVTCMPSKDSGLAQQENNMVNEMLEMVESSLDQGQDTDSRGRFLFVRVTLTQTSNTLLTATKTHTLYNSCVAGTFSQCPGPDSSTTDTTDSSKDEMHPYIYRSAENRQFPEAIVTTSQGHIVDISTILPSKVRPESRSDPAVGGFQYMEGLLGDTTQSGSLSWSEMAMDSPIQSCGRANHDRRARVVQLSREVTTSSKTSTFTEMAVASSTLTFNVQHLSCTSSDFTFAVPLC